MPDTLFAMLLSLQAVEAQVMVKVRALANQRLAGAS